MFARFKHWFVNVFWYHYRWPTLGFIAVTALVGSMIYTFVTRDEPDIPYMMVGIGYRDEAVTEGLDAFLAERFGDVNGDGKVFYRGEYIDLNLSDTADPQTAQVNTTRFIGTLASRGCSLLVYTEGSLDIYEKDNSLVYLDLTAHGIKASEGHTGRADITEHPAIISARFTGTRVYASVVAYSDGGEGVLSDQQVQALEVVRALVNTL